MTEGWRSSPPAGVEWIQPGCERWGLPKRRSSDSGPLTLSHGFHHSLSQGLEAWKVRRVQRLSKDNRTNLPRVLVRLGVGKFRTGTGGRGVAWGASGAGARLGGLSTSRCGGSAVVPGRSNGLLVGVEARPCRCTTTIFHLRRICRRSLVHFVGGTGS